MLPRLRLQLSEQKAEVKETELPQDRPTEPEEADRVVTENESKKPKEDDPKIAAVQTSASTEVGCRRSHRDAKFGGHSGRAAFRRAGASAPARARGAHARPGRRNWSRISTSTSGTRRNASKNRPRSRFASRSTAWATCSRPSIEKGSGDTAFDEAALAMVRRSDPVPVPPPLIADEGLTFTLPVIFRVKGKG